MKAKDLLSIRHNPSIMFYGPAGCGKTALVSQSPNSYMFDFDDGMLTAALLEDKFSSLRRNCEFDTYVEDNPNLPKMWMKAERKINEFITQSAKGALKYDFILVDSLTGMSKAIYLQVMHQTGNVWNKPQIQHWGDMVLMMEKALTLLRSLKCPLILTAHEMSYVADGTNLIRPMSITEKHGKNKLAWLFDEVFHMKLRPSGPTTHKYMVSGHSTTSIMARTRSAMKGEAVDITDMGLAGLLEKIGYKGKEVSKNIETKTVNDILETK